MIKLISVNIERSRHLKAVSSFLLNESADTVCFQEICEEDIPHFRELLPEYEHVFAPMTRETEQGKTAILGIAIFSKYGLQNVRHEYYRKESSSAPLSDFDDKKTFTNKNHLVLVAEIQHGGVYTIATTHFTWSDHGLATPQQHSDMRALLGVLAEQREFVLCGDFNAPRGGEIFAMLAEKYEDNIPLEYKTSIDVHLHRAGHLPAEKMDQKMVDGLFSTPGYKVSDVRLEFGVSDHAAIVANIEKESA